MDLTTRIEEPEWMDTRPLSPRELEQALACLALSNRFLGGHASVLRRFDTWSTRWASGETIHVLDVGVGGGDLLLALRSWADRAGRRLALTGIDSTAAVLDCARRKLRGRDVELRQEDLFAFARSGRRFDYVTASLLLHHIPIERQTEALKALDALATRGVVVSDLRRNRLAYWGVKAFTAAFGDPVTRHDGPVSVARAFTVQELEELALQAKLPYLRARSESFFRATLAGDKA